MSLVAYQYPEEDKRSKVMGFVLGSIAVGVLAGYPMGSVLYDLEGKMAPFLLVAALLILLIGPFILPLIVFRFLFYLLFPLAFSTQFGKLLKISFKFERPGYNLFKIPAIDYTFSFS